MKKLVATMLVSLLIFGLASMAMATMTEEKERKYGFSLTSNFYPSGYVGPLGYRTNIGPVLITELTQELGREFYIYMWNLTGLKESGLDETDFNLGWAGDFTIAGIQLKADLGVGYWDTRDRFNSGGPQTDYWNIWTEIGQEFQAAENLKVLVYARPEWVEAVQENGEFSEGGFQGAIGLRPEWTVGKFIFPLACQGNLRVVYDSGLYGGESAWIGRLTAQASWQVTDNVAIILPGVDFSQPFASLEDKDGRGTEFMAFTGLALSF